MAGGDRLGVQSLPKLPGPVLELGRGQPPGEAEQRLFEGGLCLVGDSPGLPDQDLRVTIADLSLLQCRAGARQPFYQGAALGDQGLGRTLRYTEGAGEFADEFAFRNPVGVPSRPGNARRIPGGGLAIAASLVDQFGAMREGACDLPVGGRDGVEMHTADLPLGNRRSCHVSHTTGIHRQCKACCQTSE